MVESRSIVTGAVPGPQPSDQARRIASAMTASSWRTCPKVNERRKVPSVRRHHLERQHPLRRSGAQSVGVVDVAPARQDREHEAQHLAPRKRAADAPGQAHHRVHERFESEADRDRRR